jgi:ribosomal protein L34E
MTHDVRNSETIDHCPRCGTLHISVERGRVVARAADGGDECRHTWEERNAMRNAELTKLRKAARAERDAKAAKRTAAVA